MTTENLAPPKPSLTPEGSSFSSGLKVALQDFRTSVKELAELIFSSPTAVIGMIIVLLWVFVAIFAPLITNHTALEQDYKSINKAPTAQHVLGTDNMGRDVWARVAYGARTILSRRLLRWMDR
jgi:ABC-type dipeptide/oligopeptide/nickel transport system permease subunit